MTLESRAIRAFRAMLFRRTGDYWGSAEVTCNALPDGSLYVATKDGGEFNARYSVEGGKIRRIGYSLPIRH